MIKANPQGRSDQSNKGKQGTKVELEGVIVETMPNAHFKVRITHPDLPENFIVDGYIAGKMRMNFIRIIPGDRVKIELDLQAPQLGRIVYRYK